MKQDRRSFLKSSTVIAGATAIGTAPLSGAFASNDDTIKIALIGCGNRGTGAAVQALSTKQNLKLVAMADAFHDRLDSSYKILKQKFGDKVDVTEDRQFVGFEGYKNAIPLADVVLLVTRPGFRPIHTEEAVKQCQHASIQNAGAVDRPDTRTVSPAAEETKKQRLSVVVGLQRR